MEICFVAVILKPQLSELTYNDRFYFEEVLKEHRLYKAKYEAQNK